MKQIIITSVQAVPAYLFHCLLCVALSLLVLGMQTGFSYALYADSALSLTDNLKRIQLVKQVVNAPQSIQKLSSNDIEIVLKNPSLTRVEMAISAWHYHGESCALDIYFTKDSLNPDYIEYRPLSMNADVEAQFVNLDQPSLDAYCLKDILQIHRLIMQNVQHHHGKIHTGHKIIISWN